MSKLLPMVQCTCDEASPHPHKPPLQESETGLRKELEAATFSERALAAVLPSGPSFPFTVRLHADTLAQNGGSTALAVCGACLAMADAGLPLPKLVAGGCGMVIVGWPSEVGCLRGVQASLHMTPVTSRGSGLLPSRLRRPGRKHRVYPHKLPQPHSGVCVGLLSDAAAGPMGDGDQAPGPGARLSRYALLVDPQALEVRHGDMRLNLAGGVCSGRARSGGVALLMRQGGLCMVCRCEPRCPRPTTPWHYPCDS